MEWLCSNPLSLLPDLDDDSGVLSYHKSVQIEMGSEI